MPPRDGAWPVSWISPSSSSRRTTLETVWLVRPVASDGGTTTTVRLSLLRAPRFPDPDTDQGVHRFRYAFVPGAGIAEAVREGYRINLPERSVPGDSAVAPLVAVDGDPVVVESVKLADDRSGAVVVRLYEALGRRARSPVTAGFRVASAVAVDLLERPLPDGHAAFEVSDDGAVPLSLRPFQIITLRMFPAID
ncbi:hypothetical protein HYQ63_02485 [Streptomyces sp. Rer75]|nr:hypothetical protein HYQ63_02485 [Streptomyces sp. Rer75]